MTKHIYVRRIHHKPVHHTDDVDGVVFIDRAEDGQVIGVEVLDCEATEWHPQPYDDEGDA